MLLFQRIEDMAYTHTDARRAIGELLLAEKSQIKNYSMQEIADRAGTSKSSLVRFAKALGYSGWKEFLEAFLSERYYEESHYTDIDPNFPFKAGDSSQTIALQLSNLAVESVLDTADQLDLNELDKAVLYLRRARQIALLGQPPNTFVGDLFRRKMASIGRNVLMPNGGDQGLLAHTLSQADCAILISYTGNNANRVPMSFLPFLKAQRVPIIAITGLGDNLLRREADCVLSMSSRERMYTKIATFATEESIQFILNMLYACYFAQEYDRNMEYKIKTSKELEKRDSRYAEIREDELF